MERDVEEELLRLRQKMRDIETAIAYFERLEARLPAKDRGAAKAGTLSRIKKKCAPREL